MTFNSFITNFGKKIITTKIKITLLKIHYSMMELKLIY